MDHFGYLFAAYTIIFAAIFLYVLVLWRGQRAVESDLRDLERDLRALTHGRNSQGAINQPSEPSPADLVEG